MKSMKRIGKLIKHKFALEAYRFKKSEQTIDLIAEAFYGIGARWHGEYHPIYTYMVMFDYLRQYNVQGSGLEIGGGYSTILLSEYAASNKLSIRSIDVNPDKYLRIIPSKSSRRFLFEKINRVDRLTVSFDEVLTAYRNTLNKKIQEVGIDSFCEHLRKYVSTDKLSECINLVREEKLGEYILTLPILKGEKEFYLSNNLMSGSGYCSELKSLDEKFDFIFFDCGEYSSLAEWFILEDQIKQGGYVFLHDIYFPKSIKNFIVAVLMESSNKWEILYVDKYSKQGGLVARRV